MSKDAEHLKQEGVDIYALLEVPSNADDSAIRRAYRKQALIYHPDKNKSTDAQLKFHQLTLALGVLNDAEQRKVYDQWLAAKELDAERVMKLGSERRRMKEELEVAERKRKWGQRDATLSQNQYALEVERLRKEGAQKRREYESRYMEKLNHSQTQDEMVKENKSARTVRVRWRIKDGISSLFTEDVLIGCLSVFGEVESAQVLKRSSSRYDFGLCVFRNASSAQRAVEYDFDNGDMTLWEHTMYKRVSKLLRDVKWDRQPSSNGVLNKEDMSFEEYMDRTLMKLSAKV